MRSFQTNKQVNKRETEDTFALKSFRDNFDVSGSGIYF